MSFPKAVALKIVSQMLSSPVKVIGPEITDGIGELTNIITGYSKKDLVQYALSISLPSVVIGKKHFVSAPSGEPTLVVPFTCTHGPFTLEVTLKTK